MRWHFAFLCAHLLITQAHLVEGALSLHRNFDLSLTQARLAEGAARFQRNFARSLGHSGVDDIEHLQVAYDAEPEPIPDAGAEAEEQADTLVSRLAKLKNAPEFLRSEAERDVGLFTEYLLVGFEFKLHTQIWNASSFVLALSIIIVYVRLFYKPDHGRGWHGASHEDITEAIDKQLDEDRDTMLWGLLSPKRFSRYTHPPDLILVFDNPGVLEKEGKGSGEMDPDVLKTVLSQDVKKREAFPSIWKMLVRRGLIREADETFSPRMLDAPLDKVSLVTALLQDIYQDLPGKGFDSDVFRSVDDRHLFVCITLAQDAWIDLYMRREGWELPLQPQIVDELGMGHCSDPDALAPPYVRYDARTVKRLYDMGIIEEDDPRHVYETHHGDGRPDYCIGRKDRLRIVLKELQTNIFLGAAKIQGLLVEWYPVHSMHTLHRFGITWASFRKMLDPSFEQPIVKIEGYFGARLAFMFGWHGLYCKFLLPLSICALLWQGGAIVLEMAAGVENAKRQILGFTLVVLVWSRMALNHWDREQEYFLKLFNLDTGSVVPTVRPEFRGVLAPSPADSYVEELVAPWAITMAKRILSKSISFGAILVVAACINLWFSIFEGRFNLLASICLTVQIQIFQLLFNHLSLILNEFENHKYASDFYDSLLWKRFSFGFVNSYWAFFYIAVKQRFTEQGCRASGCFVDLRNQLRMTLIILVICQIFITLAQVAYVQLCLKWAEEKEQKAVNEEGKAAKLKSAFIEAQLHYMEFGTVEQIAMMQQLALTLGYVLLFGGVAPIIIPFCLAAFAVTLRSAAFLLVTSTKQVLPENSFGIGAWRDVVAILMDVAVLFTGFLLAVFSETFDGAALIAKLTGIIGYCLAVFLLWRITDILCPPCGETTKILNTRRTRTKELLMDVAVDYPGGEKGGSSKKDPYARRQSVLTHSVTGLFKDAVGDDDRMVAEGDWFSIPYVRTTEPDEGSGVATSKASDTTQSEVP